MRARVADASLPVAELLGYDLAVRTGYGLLLASPPDMGWFPVSMAAQGRPDLTREVMLERREIHGRLHFAFQKKRASHRHEPLIIAARARA